MGDQLSSSERNSYDLIRNNQNIALLKGSYDGIPAAFIVMVIETDGEMEIYPLAKLLDESEAEKIRGPEDQELSGPEES